jgi:hypothetical protein
MFVLLVFLFHMQKWSFSYTEVVKYAGQILDGLELLCYNGDINVIACILPVSLNLCIG